MTIILGRTRISDHHPPVAGDTVIADGVLWQLVSNPYGLAMERVDRDGITRTHPAFEPPMDMLDFCLWVDSHAKK